MVKQKVYFNSKVRILRNVKLRKIRHGLRNVLFLEYNKRRKALNLRMGDVRVDDSLNFDVKRKELRDLLKEREGLDIHFFSAPINCFICGKRDVDLIQDPCSLFWFCFDCNLKSL